MLVKAGLIDAERLETMLIREHLIWQGEHTQLMNYAVVEAWARHWSALISAAG